ncbi:ADP-ribosylglycohydrolase [Halopolyspora algeriensis]|uniref:ADP-ribosylglycohydrolase n=1 Tax=Halopolyspora algeriensis TaxID=1500506 RepID=A0A368VXU8_9ACTN|nr:ADP-ribosylglycohydrolase family protein [Halopolyspora algeriensis]RCW46781.1 ADP-ribosylglycohydrolase [Halopolyspora algeriensis]
MTENASWFADSHGHTRSDVSPGLMWSERFRGAMLGGAVGDALGAGVRHRSTPEIEHWFGAQGVTDYLPLFGRRGAATEVTQLTVFTLEALLRAKAEHGETDDRLPTLTVRANHLRWLYTQGVPWEYAMSGLLRTHPEPNGWLLERPELFSTRNPGGEALRGLGSLALQSPAAPEEPLVGATGLAGCITWSAPAMVWSSSEERVFAAAADVANTLTPDGDVQGAAGLHADVLAQLLQGSELWPAVSASEDKRLAVVRYATGIPAALRRVIHAAMFLTRQGQRPLPSALDLEFATADRPCELGIALAAVATADDFSGAVLTAINQSSDSSVAGALAGQLAGAIHGPGSIPARWLEELELRDVIETLVADATEAFAPPPSPPPLPKWAQRYVTENRSTLSGPLELEQSGPTPRNAVDDSVPDPYPVVSERVEDDVDIADPVDSVLEGDEEHTLDVDAPAFRDIAAEPGFAEVPVPDSSAHEDSESLARGDEQPMEVESEIRLSASAPPESVPSGFAELVAEQVGEGGESAADEHAGGDGDVWYAASVGTASSDEDDAPTSEHSPASDIAGLQSPPAAAAAAEADVAETPIGTAGQRAAGEHAAVEDVDSVAPSRNERVLGCFLGGALGDAFGADLESVTAEQVGEMFASQGPTGLREAFGVHGAITDGTQMTLFTAEGLIRASTACRILGSGEPLPEVQFAYQRWLHTQGIAWEVAAGSWHSAHPEPDGWLLDVPGLFARRAPDRSVLAALDRLCRGLQGGSITEPVNDSSGSEGVLRAAPAALWSSDPAEVFDLAARTSALTHGHPNGYLAAGAFAVIVQQAVLGRGLDDGVWLALQVLETWDGYEETSTALAAAVDLASSGVPTPEQLAETLGQGRSAEQVLAIAVCATLASGEDVESALRIAVRHSGDSDAACAVCGTIIGALVGIAGLPVDWLAELELREVVERMAMDCIAEFDRTRTEPHEPGRDESSPDDEEWSRRYPVRPLQPERPATTSDLPTQLLPVVTDASEDTEPGTAGEVADAPEAVESTEVMEVTGSGDDAESVEAEPVRAERREPWSGGRGTSTSGKLPLPDAHQPKPAPRRITGLGAHTGARQTGPGATDLPQADSSQVWRDETST